MRRLDESTTLDFLRESGAIETDERAAVVPLTGGVSNQVFRISFANPRRGDWVLKQACEQLRVAEPWFCSVERIWREVETLRLCESLLQPLSTSIADATEYEPLVPQVVFEDRQNFVYAMTAAPADHEVWKQQLLTGQLEARVARACGHMLGTLHAHSWQSADVAGQLADRSFFEQLRVDPYYRHVARQQPMLRRWLEPLIESLDIHRLALVHGDFSPKNLLVFDRQVMLIDFEVGHFGDPAFDLGFFLTHLVLKSIHAGPNRAPAYLQLATEFWKSYRDQVLPHIGQPAYESLEARAIRHLAGCLFARVDGKSKAEYLGDPAHQQAARNLATELFVHSISRWQDIPRPSP